MKICPLAELAHDSLYLIKYIRLLFNERDEDHVSFCDQSVNNN